MAMEPLGNGVDITQLVSVQRLRVKADFRIQPVVDESIQIGFVEHPKRDVDMNFGRRGSHLVAFYAFEVGGVTVSF